MKTSGDRGNPTSRASFKSGALTNLSLPFPGRKIVTKGFYTGADNLIAMTMARNYNEFLVQEVLRHSGGAAVAVDFGAGSGTFACKLRQRGLKVICIETDASLRVDLQSQGFECWADIEQIPEAGFDYIFSLNVLEHI